MPIPFTCPYCGAQTPVDERYAGQSGPCYQCGQTVTVPGGPAAYAPAAAPGAGSNTAVVVAVVLVVLGLLALLMCAGAMVFFARVGTMRPRPVPPPVPIAERLEDSAEDFPEVPGVDLPGEFYESPAPERFTRVHLEPSDGELRSLLRTHAAKAKAAGRKPFVEFGKTSSAACVQFTFSLHDRRMTDALSGTYLIHLNLDQWGTVPSRASFDVSDVPAFFELDERGRPTGRSTEITLGDFETPQDMARVLKPFFQRGSR